MHGSMLDAMMQALELAKGKARPRSCTKKTSCGEQRSGKGQAVGKCRHVTWNFSKT